MALLFIDSFDHYATADLATYYNTAAGAISAAGTGRHSSVALTGATYAASGQIGRALPAVGDATAIVGFARRSATPVAPLTICAISDAGPANVTHVFYQLNADGSISAYRANVGIGSLGFPATINGTLLGSSAAGVVLPYTWQYIEFKTLIHASAGTVDVQIDGVNVLTLSGLDTTQGSSAAQWNAFTAQTLTGKSDDYPRIDDLYVCDGSGAANNDVLGDVRIDVQLPAGAGATAGWTPSAGSNYACVDEATPNGDTDYVSTSTLDAIDTYAFDDLVNAGGTIFGLQVTINAKKTDAGTSSIVPVVRRAGTDYPFATAAALGTTYAPVVRQPYETDPATAAAWTEANFNAAEFGVKKVA